MQLPKLLFLTAAPSSLLAALLPTRRTDIIPPPGQLKLDPSAGIHFLDCSPREDAVLTARQTGAPEPTWLSILIYCANNTDCLDPTHVPAASDVCVKKTSTTPGDWNHWENSGDWQYCRFEGGAEPRGWFSWVISRFARILPAGEECGYAEDDGKAPFDGFRGDELRGAAPDGTHVCSRVYYFTAAKEDAEVGGAVKGIRGGF